MNEKVTWAMAMVLISDHGTDAENVAGLCLTKAERAGKPSHVLKWQSVLAAIEELLKAEPDYGEWPN